MRARTTGSSASPEEQDIQRRMLALASEGEASWSTPGAGRAARSIDTRSALVQRFAPWNIVLVATLSSREIQATIDAEMPAPGPPCRRACPTRARRGAGDPRGGPGLGAVLALDDRPAAGLQARPRRHALALEQKAGELHLASHVFESSKEGILITDAERRILAVNPAFTAISGYRAEEVVGKQPDLLASGKHEPDFYRNMWQTIRETGSWSGEIWNQRRDGSVFPSCCRSPPVSADGEVRHCTTWAPYRPHRSAREAEGPHPPARRVRSPPGLLNRSPAGRPIAQVMAGATSGRNRAWRPWSSTSTASKTINELPRPRHRRPAAAGRGRPPPAGAPPATRVSRMGATSSW